MTEKDKAKKTVSKAMPVPSEGDEKVAAKSDKASSDSGGRYTAVHRPLRHPYTGALFLPGKATEALELDNWLKGQIQAGLIREI